MENTNVNPIIQEPEGKADSSIIVLHGLGCDGSDFDGLKDELMDCGAPLQNTRMILPTAPYRPITMNNGYEMRAWYDFYDTSRVDKIDVDGMNDTYRLIKSLIAEEESKGIPRNRILLGGFSQGGCMTLYSAVRLEAPIGGFFCLSGYTADNSKDIKHIGAAITTPIFVGYGYEDSVISRIYTEESIEEMKKMGATHISSHGYPGMDHELCQQEIIDLARFISKILS